MLPETLRWIGQTDGTLELIDQRLLPGKLVYIRCNQTREVFDAIRDLAVRGAPAIGVTAAYGAVIAARSGQDPLKSLIEGCDYLVTARPTAVNLSWALDRMKRFGQTLAERNPSREKFLQVLLAQAKAIHEEDIAMCRSIGDHGSVLINDGDGVLTHCNAGSLATSFFGTALAVIYAAFQQGKKFAVYADETRPVLQGARLTHWELTQAGVDATLLCDNMAGYAMKQGKITKIITGADRIAANGDTANKIGTYSVAVLAKHHHIPFYVAAPISTFDFSIPDGGHIPIEERNADEVRQFGCALTSLPDAKVWNPAFDVTPAELITGIITDRGIIDRPTTDAIRNFFSHAPKGTLK
ncbi:MAG: S-methyl-5-thioribose-1-phosphate isomerase [Phycisphaerae bacterium]|jgi:methylthioribose-1-phosphate isomerase|nr:S-methyl-5-thioribose-1-phosphate isomerase [Phycisphaerae bacterium]